MKRFIGLYALVVMLFVTIFCFCGCSAILEAFGAPSDDTMIEVPDNGFDHNIPSEKPDEGQKPDTDPEPDDKPDPDTPDDPPVEPQPPIDPVDPEPITFTVIFKCGEDEQSCEVEQNSTVDSKPIPDKKGYIFVGWTCGGELYDFSAPVTEDLTLIAEFELIVYNIKYVADGVTVAEFEFTAEFADFAEPAVPEKPHYAASWEDYILNCEDIVVNAVYVPINYTITYVVEGITFEVVEYNFESLPTSTPEIPQKKGYTAEWESFVFGENVTVNAVYTMLPGTDGLIYELSDGGYTVIGYEGTESDIVIPVEYNDVPVTAIGSRAFFNRTDIKSVVMFAEIKSIGAFAFNGCTIEEITLPGSVTEIGNKAFAQCVNLKSAIVSDGITAIPAQTFYGCSSLAYVYIGASVNYIGVNAFYMCPLKRVDFADKNNWIKCGSDGSCIAVSAETLSDAVSAGAFLYNHECYEFIK